MELVTKATNGQVTFQHYPAEQLGKAKDMAQLTVAGVADISYIVPSYSSEKYPLTAVAELPGIFDTECQGSLAFYKISHNGGILETKEFGPNQLRPLVTIALPAYQIQLATSREVKTAKDLEGLKIRTTGGAMDLMMRSIGGVPVRMAAPEIYESLTRGTLDGLIFSYQSSVSYDFGKILKSGTEGLNFGTAIFTYSIGENKIQVAAGERAQGAGRGRRADHARGLQALRGRREGRDRKDQVAGHEGDQLRRRRQEGVRHRVQGRGGGLGQGHQQARQARHRGVQGLHRGLGCKPLTGRSQKEANAAAPAGPLAGVKVIDLTSVMMGPYATMLLGDYGADVIKVESPDGDVMRYAAPMRHPKMGAMYLQGNRNKRSIALDLKKDGGRAALLRLATTADVFVHNVRPAAMARLKLGADDLLAVNPRLVYASLHGFGETGPYAGRPGL